jgi:hypothetical protein
MARSSDGMGSLVKWGILGVVGYFGYKWIAGSATPPAVAPAPAGPAPAAPPPAPTGPSADSIYAAMISKANAPAAGLTPDQWNYFLAQVWKGTPPDPVSVFQVQRDANGQLPLMTAAVYWGPMAAALKASGGLSGLGVFGGLGALAGRRRR